MPHPFDSTSSSPDAQHTAHFAYAGDIRFGPPYFSLLVDAYSFGQRIFGDVHLWSSEGPIVMYRKDYAGNEGTERFEVDTTKITEWKDKE